MLPLRLRYKKILASVLISPLVLSLPLIEASCYELLCGEPYSKFLLTIYFTHGYVSFHVTLSIHLSLSSPLPMSISLFFRPVRCFYKSFLQMCFIFSDIHGNMPTSRLSSFIHVWLFATLWTVAARLLCPWDSPGKSIRVVCHAVLRGSSWPQWSNLSLLYLLHWQVVPYHQHHLVSPSWNQ